MTKLWQAFVFSIVGTALWLSFVMTLGSPHLSLRADWCDSLSNLYFTQIFLSKGYEIYGPASDLVREPTEPEKAEFLRTTGFSECPANAVFKDRTMALVSPALPRPYPPGLYLSLAPASFLLSRDLLSARNALALNLALWLFLAHLSAIILFGHLRKFFADRASRFIGGVFLFFAYFELMRWTLNSQYDALPVFVLLLSLMAVQRARYLAAICIYSVAIFLHFRCLFYFPVLFWSARQFILSTEARRPRSYALLMGAAVLALSSLVALIANMRSLSDTSNYAVQGAYFGKLLENWATKTLPLALGLGFLSWYFVRRGFYLALTCVWWTAIMYLASPLSREWYAIYFYPLALMIPAVATRVNRNALAALLFYVTLMSAVFANNSPFEFRFFKEASALLGK